MSLAQIEMVITNAYNAEREHMANNVLSPLPMDLATFQMRGRARFGDSVFTKLFDRIQALDPHVELLVCGFSRSGVPHIFKTNTLGDIDRCDAIGFTAIGSGAAVATDLLYGNADFMESRDLGLITYRLCEAKFSAEGAVGVGPQTMVASFGSDGMTTVVSEDTLKGARALWDRRRQSKIPERLLGDLRKGRSLDPEHGWVALETAKRAYVEQSSKYAQTREAVEKLRAQGQVSDDQWKAFVQVADLVPGQARIVQDGFTSWDESGKKPAGFDEALQALIATKDQLKQMLRSIEPKA
jgi:hypothetical protein